MGMTATEAEGGLHVRITALPAPWIQLTPAGSKPRLLLRVASLKAAGQQLKAAAIAMKKDKNSLSIADPDGNILVFVQGKDR
jgi:hypothetical protein